MHKVGIEQFQMADCDWAPQKKNNQKFNYEYNTLTSVLA